MNNKSSKKKHTKFKSGILVFLLLMIVLVGVFYVYNLKLNTRIENASREDHALDDEVMDANFLEYNIAQYSDQPYVLVNDNIPFLTPEELTTEAYESYADLDKLGRCGEAYACVGKETMPTQERGPIGHIKPSGWVQAKYFGIVNSEPPYLYNRCHLIAFCLTGENDNEKNLITGTRYMNVEGMLPWEEKVAKYVDDTGNHVMYRVTPDFRGDELVARGILIEAYSVEDNGAGICFNVYCYNVQPGVIIDYMTGESRLEE